MKMFLERVFGNNKKSLSVKEDILKNLDRLLNSRRGAASFHPEMGLGDYFYSPNREKIRDEIIEQIIQNVERFEPRIKVSEIEEIGGTGKKLKFKIRFIIKDTQDPLEFIFSGRN